MPAELKDFFLDLQKREIIADHANLENFFQLKPNEKVIYWGVDCTNDSLHIGSLFTILQLVRFAQKGFKMLLILGVATSKIGDPSDKDKERPLLEVNQIDGFQEKIKEQLNSLLIKPKKDSPLFLNFSPLEKFYSNVFTNGELLKNVNKVLEIPDEGNNKEKWEKYLQYIWPLKDSSKFQILNNQDWLEKINFIDFLRKTGKNLTVAYLSAKETIKKRIDTGISYLEFSYPLIQAYDFYYLYENYNCHGQLGGSDQWGNLTTGLKLIHNYHPQNKCFALTFNLLTDKEGKKISKSSAGKTIWLSPEKTSFPEFYDFLRNLPDEKALKFLSQFTFLTEEQVKKIDQLNNPRKLRIPQRILIELLFYLLYGERGMEWLKKESAK